MPCTGCQTLRFAAVLPPVMAGVRAHSPVALPSKLGSLPPNRSTRRYALKNID